MSGGVMIEYKKQIVIEGEIMIIMVCIDEDKGLAFSGRRQSQDRVLRADILQECRGKRLYMNSYSYQGFPEAQQNIGSLGVEFRTVENFIELAGAGDFCFVENVDVEPWIEQIEGIVVYEWNRKYPADLYFSVDFEENTWTLKSEETFTGSSHPQIVKKVYERRK